MTMLIAKKDNCARSGGEPAAGEKFESLEFRCTAHE